MSDIVLYYKTFWNYGCLIIFEKCVVTLNFLFFSLLLWQPRDNGWSWCINLVVFVSFRADSVLFVCCSVFP